MTRITGWTSYLLRSTNITNFEMIGVLERDIDHCSLAKSSERASSQLLPWINESNR